MTTTPNWIAAQGVAVNPNLIINGDMKIAQRGTSISVPDTGAQIQTLDRFVSYCSGSAATVTQDTDTPTTAEAGVQFEYSLKHDVTTANASVGAAEYCAIGYKVEGYDFAQLGWGSSGAKDATLSFWLKSDVATGTMDISFRNSAGNRSYVTTISVSDNNWNKYTVTIPGDTSGTWLTTNGVGANIFWSLGYGSNFDGTADTWLGSQALSTTSGDNFVDSTSNNIWLTGVKLEVGDTATPFVPDDHTTALAKCQRYYWRETKISGQLFPWVGYSNGSNLFFAVRYPVEMRATPTRSLIGSIANFRDRSSIADTAPSSYTNNNADAQGTVFYSNLAGTRGSAGMTYVLSTGSGHEFDAEL